MASPQRTIGNAATARLLRSNALQRDSISRDRSKEEEKQRDEDRGDRRSTDRRRNRQKIGLADPFDNLDSDWAGRMLLAQYLYGKGRKIDLRNDPDWTAYMQADTKLRDRVWVEVGNVAMDLADPWRVKRDRHPIDHHFHAQLENGEGIIGYQYLHGTNEKVGDFHIVGWGEVHPQQGAGVAWIQGKNPFLTRRVWHDVGTRVDLDLTFIWNDIIDPNANYWTDTVKNAIAEYLTLGGAESYTISIGWRNACSVFLSPAGRRQVTGGYPAV